MCVTYPLKYGIDRPRPFEEYAVDALKTSFATGSFPSGHTAAAFCAATVITMFDRQKGLPFILLALFIAFTRMYMYAHYPTDVLAGAAIGIVCAFVAAFICLRSNSRTVYVLKGKISD